MKQEQFIRIRVKLMEQLRQGAEWSDEEILERIAAVSAPGTED
mgnify:CR=1 FL=1